MYIAIIYVPNVWGMLLSKNFAAKLGGHIHMYLLYAIIPTTTSRMVLLYGEVGRRYHVEVPKKLENGEQIVPQEHPPHFESEICHLFHRPSPPPRRKRRIFQHDTNIQSNDE